MLKVRERSGKCGGWTHMRMQHGVGQAGVGGGGEATLDDVFDCQGQEQETWPSSQFYH